MAIVNNAKVNIGMHIYGLVSVFIVFGNIAEFELLDSMVVLEKAMPTHSSTLAWKVQWTEEPGRLQSMQSLGVGHD